MCTKDNCSCHPDLNRCPSCGGPADNGHDKEMPPSPYFCRKCTKENAPPWQDEFDVFLNKLYARQIAGGKEYHDQSWKNPADMTVGELCEELLDISGWAFQCYRRMKVLQQKLAELEESIR